LAAGISNFPINGFLCEYLFMVRIIKLFFDLMQQKMNIRHIIAIYVLFDAIEIEQKSTNSEDK